VEHRVGDRRIIRLIQKWLKAGVLEDGIVTVSDKGTGQGSVISPLLASLYLHYVLDLCPSHRAQNRLLVAVMRWMPTFGGRPGAKQPFESFDEVRVLAQRVVVATMFSPRAVRSLTVTRLRTRGALIE
jgi:hypothetical protein